MWNKKLFLVSQVLSFKLTKQTNKNLANATFNCFEKKGSIIIYIWQGIEYVSTFPRFSHDSINTFVFCICYLAASWPTLDIIKKTVSLPCVNPLNASVDLIQKPVNGFAVQINWLVSIWRQNRHLMGWSRCFITFLPEGHWSDVTSLGPWFRSSA